MIWAILTKEKGVWKFTKAEPPCNKGQFDIPIWKWTLSIGWQQRAEETP
jgi:hypothetical protein